MAVQRLPGAEGPVRRAPHGDAARARRGHRGAVRWRPGHADERDAVAMLRRLAGRAHEVVTGVCVVAGGVACSGVERSVGRLAPMSEEELGWYAATGEPLDKARGDHVDGKGAWSIETVEGSPSNVAGLPVRLLLRLVRQAGLDLGFPQGMSALARPGVFAAVIAAAAFALHPDLGAAQRLPGSLLSWPCLSCWPSWRSPRARAGPANGVWPRSRWRPERPSSLARWGSTDCAATTAP